MSATRRTTDAHEDRGALHPAARQRDVAAAGHCGREMQCSMIWVGHRDKEPPIKRNTLRRAALALGLLAMFVHAPSLARAHGKLSAEEAQKIGVEANDPVLNQTAER
jgi:hypothetical protein